MKSWSEDDKLLASAAMFLLRHFRSYDKAAKHCRVSTMTFHGIANDPVGHRPLNRGLVKAAAEELGWSPEWTPPAAITNISNENNIWRARLRVYCAFWRTKGHAAEKLGVQKSYLSHMLTGLSNVSSKTKITLGNWWVEDEARAYVETLRDMEPATVDGAPAIVRQAWETLRLTEG